MKSPKLTSSIKVFSTILFGSWLTAATAAEIYKANNADALNATTSWTNGVAPGAADVAVFDNTLDGSIVSYDLGGAMTWGGISFRDAAASQSITGASQLTLADGSAGIDMTTQALADLTISCPLNLGASGGQTFNVENSDRLLLVNAKISGTGPLVKSGSGTFKSSYNAHVYTGGTVIAGGTLVLGVNNGLAAGTLSATNGGTLDLGGYGLTAKAYSIHIAGAGVGGAGALVDNAGGQLNQALTNLVLDADATVGGTKRFDMRPVGSGFPSVDLGGHTLTKVGANQIWWQQLPVTSGNVVVQAGTLGFNNVNLPGTGLLTINNGANVTMFRNAASAASTFPMPMDLEGGSTINLNGTDTGDVIDQGISSAITLNGEATISVMAAGAVLELSGPISGPGGIIKANPGTLLLSGTSTYGGDTTVGAGELILGSGWSAAGNVTVDDGASIRFQPAAHDAVLNLNSLTLGNSGNTQATFDLGGFANPTGAVVNLTNALTLNGVTTVNLADTSGLAAGTFKLLTFGSIGGSGSFEVGVVPGFAATLATNGNSIEMTLQAATLAWLGQYSSDWLTSSPDIYTNWLNVLLQAPAGFSDGLPVVFNDSLTGTPYVNVAETVQPSSVTVSNTATAYYFYSGGGKISGNTGLTKVGTNLLSMGVANNYNGPTVIADGVFQLAISDALPVAGSPVSVTNNGILDLYGYDQTVNGLDGNGTVDSTLGASTLTFAVGSSGDFSGTMRDSNGGTLALKKPNGGVQRLAGDNTYSGGTLIQGPIQVGSDNALGSGLIWMSYVGALASDSTTAHTFTNTLEIDGAPAKTFGDAVNNGALTFSGPITMNGGNRILTCVSDVIFNGGVDNGVNFTKQGPGTLTMNGTNTYTGGTTVSEGTLAGTGSFAGAVAINAATLSPGTGIGTMTINNTLFLNTTSSNYFEIDAAAHTNDMVAGLTGITYGGTLTVANLAGTPANGQNFQLFSTGGASVAGNFAVTNLPVLDAGLAWNWDPANGMLSVVSAIASNPTNITFSVGGGSLNLSWPADHLGWIAQSNSVALTDTNAWFDIAGSETSTNLAITLDPAMTNVFYRIRKPN